MENVATHCNEKVVSCHIRCSSVNVDADGYVYRASAHVALFCTPLQTVARVNSIKEHCLAVGTLQHTSTGGEKQLVARILVWKSQKSPNFIETDDPTQCIIITNIIQR